MTENGETEKALAVAITEVGLSLMDMHILQQFFQQTNAPVFMTATLTSITQQLYTAGHALDATKTGLVMAIEQRNETMDALAAAQAEIEALKQVPDANAEELAQLQTDLEQWNMNNPAVKALIDEVWAQAQQALIDELKKRKGA